MSVYSGPNTIQNGLVLHIDPSNPRSYPGAGSTLFDISGQGNNGTLTNGASVIQGSAGRVLNFDGVDDYVIMGNTLNNIVSGGSSKFSISAWIYPIGGTADGTIISMLGDSSHSENQRQFTFRIATGLLDFVWYGDLTASSFRVIRANQSISTLLWTHVGIVFDAAIGNSDLKTNIFINGVLQSTSIPFTQGVPNSIPSGSARLAIGGCYWSK